MSAKRMFDNTEVAFKLKTDAQLERAYFLFKMISNEPLVKMGTAVTKFALNVHLPVEGLIRSTVFDHFCGGVNEKDCLPVVDSMMEAGVYSVLDYSVEGKEEAAQFDATMNKVLELTKFAERKTAMPFSVFKPTGLGRLKVWQKITESEPLNQEEQREWERIKERYEVICKEAHSRNIELLIDAEETWMQLAADQLAEEMMEKYNKEKTIVFSTLQCYRWDRLDYLKRIHARAKEKGFKLGFKIVRGAYLEKENDRAKEKGYRTPICPDKQATDNEFNAVVGYILEHLDDISLFLGSHNEDSSYRAMEKMKSLEIAPNDPRVWFGQLYGMSDHITYNLAKAGYNVAKYIPFGPVKDVMPYLIRRAEENTSVAGQTSRELELIKRERIRRGL